MAKHTVKEIILTKLKNSVAYFTWQIILLGIHVQFSVLFIWLKVDPIPAVFEKVKNLLSILETATPNLNSCLDKLDSCSCQLWTTTCK